MPTSLTDDAEEGTVQASSSAPSTEKARLQLSLTGPHASHQLFRAELKKELTFFRGCDALFYEIDATASVIIAEGKTKSLEKFVSWVQVYGTELRLRKPNFQGPSLMIFIENIVWSPFVGDLEGFTVNQGAPPVARKLEPSSST